MPHNPPKKDGFDVVSFRKSSQPLHGLFFLGMLPEHARVISGLRLALAPPTSIWCEVLVFSCCI